jgi:hypothetical protein
MDLNLFDQKVDFPCLRILKKIGIEGFEERNNFSYRNFSQFRINFELKFREVLGFEIDRKLMEISWNFRI